MLVNDGKMSGAIRIPNAGCVGLKRSWWTRRCRKAFLRQRSRPRTTSFRTQRSQPGNSGTAATRVGGLSATHNVNADASAARPQAGPRTGRRGIPAVCALLAPFPESLVRWVIEIETGRAVG